MENFAAKRKMFKGTSDQSIFKDYADYSAYKSNYASIQEKEFEHLDNMRDTKPIEKVYNFIQELPDDYLEKEEI